MDVVISADLVGDEDEVEIGSWLVEDGATVAKGELIAELETSKVVVELEAPADGVLKIIEEESAVVAPGAVVARIS